MANAQLRVHVNRRDGQSQRQVGLNELRLVVIVKCVTGERPASLQRLIVTELKESPFFRVDLCVRRRQAAQTNQNHEPGPVRSPIHAVVVTQSAPVRQEDLSEYSGNNQHRTSNIEHPRVEVAGRRGYGSLTMKARKLLHTRYRVNDLEKAVRFYKDVLGLAELRRHKSLRGSELVFLKAPESEEQIELCSFPSSGLVQVQADLTHLAFEVDNLEEFGKHLAKLGLKYSDGPTTTSTGTVFAFIDVPEGYEIELIQRAKQAGKGEGY